MVPIGLRYLGWFLLVVGAIAMERATTLAKFSGNMGDESKQRLHVLYIIGPCMLGTGAILAYRFRKPPS